MAKPQHQNRPVIILHNNHIAAVPPVQIDPNTIILVLPGSIIIVNPNECHPNTDNTGRYLDIACQIDSLFGVLEQYDEIL